MSLPRTHQILAALVAGVLSTTLVSTGAVADAHPDEHPEPNPGTHPVLPADGGDRGHRGPPTTLPMRKVKGYYEMPFSCGEQWTGSTRPWHSPSSKAVDWNRIDDDGDAVVASAPGQVTTAQRRKSSSGYGKYIVITHPGGESTLYAHLKKVLVPLGSTVDQGSLIGYVGSTGNSTGSHLHYEQRPAVRGWSKVILAGQRYVYGTPATSRNCVDVPLAGNMVGDGRAEMVIFRRGPVAQFLVQQPGLAPVAISWGTTGDEPVIGDWNGDGIDDVGIRRPAESAFYLAGGPVGLPFGVPTDRPVAGDWDGDGRDEIGVRRASDASFYLARRGGPTVQVQLGDSDDISVTGDWNGDRITDLGVFDPGTSIFTLRTADAAGVVTFAQVAYGAAGDLPITGDWDGNGVTDLGVWRAGSAIFALRRAVSPRSRTETTGQVRFGRPRRWHP